MAEATSERSGCSAEEPLDEAPVQWQVLLEEEEQEEEVEEEQKEEERVSDRYVPSFK